MHLDLKVHVQTSLTLVLWKDRDGDHVHFVYVPSPCGLQ